MVAKEVQDNFLLSPPSHLRFILLLSSLTASHRYRVLGNTYFVQRIIAMMPQHLALGPQVSHVAPYNHQQLRGFPELPSF